MKDIARASPADLPERRDFSKRDKRPASGCFKLKQQKRKFLAQNRLSEILSELALVL
ncbi:hypothetical protein [Lawsonibacter sp. OA9]|uniref:hypothetical protein n=1 Tax=Lawsonibacter sp. OA9 TaxID=2914163 RepID=UPI001F0629C1|nr:hypothetical protein [Lawsonibacter sp. OA9]